MLRQATVDDIPAIIALARPTFEAFVPFGGSEEMVSHTLAGLAQFGGYVRVSEVDGQIGGFLAGLVATFKPWAADKCAVEVLFYVAPEHRKGRLAVTMLKDFIEWGRQKDCRLVAVTANAMAGGDRVGKLYERMGFAPVETAYLRRID